MPTFPYLVQQPQQARSLETMTQILDAAAQILETKTFEELTLTEVVQQAGTSVGAFYGRFKDKDGLLHALDERFFQEFERGFLDLISRPGWAQQSLPRIIRQAVEFLVDAYSRDQGVLRSLNIKARLHNDSRFREREQRAWNELFPQLQDILLRHQNEMRHLNPVLATRLGFQQMFFALREILLREHLRETAPYNREELSVELTRVYLGVQEA